MQVGDFMRRCHSWISSSLSLWIQPSVNSGSIWMIFRLLSPNWWSYAAATRAKCHKTSSSPQIKPWLVSMSARCFAEIFCALNDSTCSLALTLGEIKDRNPLPWTRVRGDSNMLSSVGFSGLCNDRVHSLLAGTQCATHSALAWTQKSSGIGLP